MNDELKHVFSSASGVWFQDGMSNRFTDALEKHLAGWNQEKYEAFSDALFSGEVKESVAEEALRTLGHLDSECPEMYQAQLNIFAKALKSDSFVVRDGASVGLDVLDDSSAKLVVLKEAMNTETVSYLKEYLEQLIREIETTQP